MESENVVFFNSGEKPDGGHLLFSVKTDEPAVKLELVKSVVIAICKFSGPDWPSDEVWNKTLPIWFLTKIKRYSLEEVSQKNTRLWEYGSWLDAMRFRGWKWYSSKITPKGFDVILEPYEFPFSVNPLEYVIYETGVELNNIEFQDFSSYQLPDVSDSKK